MRSQARAASERSREYEGHSLAICFAHHARVGGGGGTAINGLYRYVPLGRIWF